MASMDISERRLPQDGRVNVLLDRRKIDLRVSTFPGIRGEKTVIRVLDTKGVSLNLRDLGFAEDIVNMLDRIIRGGSVPQAEGENMECDLFGLAASTNDMKEGMAAFLEKRDPKFQGR